MFWTNGGPGCSGLLALFTEQGPWRPQSDGTLVHNPATWATLSSMVFLEQPAGVGFSTGAHVDDLISNDFSASEDFLLTIHAFFQVHIF